MAALETARRDRLQQQFYSSPANLLLRARPG